MAETKKGDSSVFAGTILGELAELVLRGDFIAPDDPVEEDEKIVGELVPIELALGTMAERKVTQAMAICAACRNNRSCSGIGEKEQSAECAKAHHIKAEADCFNTLKWLLIRQRLALLQGSIGVRKGGKIVKIPDEVQPRQNEMGEMVSIARVLAVLIKAGHPH